MFSLIATLSYTHTHWKLYCFKNQILNYKDQEISFLCLIQHLEAVSNEVEHTMQQIQLPDINCPYYYNIYPFKVRNVEDPGKDPPPLKKHVQHTNLQMDG